VRRCGEEGQPVPVLRTNGCREVPAWNGPPPSPRYQLLPQALDTSKGTAPIPLAGIRPVIELCHGEAPRRQETLGPRLGVARPGQEPVQLADVPQLREQPQREDGRLLPLFGQPDRRGVQTPITQPNREGLAPQAQISGARDAMHLVRVVEHDWNQGAVDSAKIDADA
jgi:hypothetical protein